MILFYLFFCRIFPSIQHGRIQMQWIIRRCVTFFLTNNSRNSRKRKAKRNANTRDCVCLDSIHRAASLSLFFLGEGQNKKRRKPNKKKWKERDTWFGYSFFPCLKLSLLSLPLYMGRSGRARKEREKDFYQIKRTC